MELTELPLSTPRKTRINRTHTQWKSLINDYENSSLTQQAFCDKHKIANSSLHKWRKRFSQVRSSFIDITQPLTTAATTINNKNTAGSLWQVELELGTGIVLRVRASECFSQSPK